MTDCDEHGERPRPPCETGDVTTHSSSTEAMRTGSSGSLTLRVGMMCHKRLCQQLVVTYYIVLGCKLLLPCASILDIGQRDETDFRFRGHSWQFNTDFRNMATTHCFNSVRHLLSDWRRTRSRLGQQEVRGKSAIIVRQHAGQFWPTPLQVRGNPSSADLVNRPTFRTNTTCFAPSPRCRLVEFRGCLLRETARGMLSLHVRAPPMSIGRPPLLSDRLADSAPARNRDAASTLRSGCALQCCAGTTLAVGKKEWGKNTMRQSGLQYASLGDRCQQEHASCSVHVEHTIA